MTSEPAERETLSISLILPYYNEQATAESCLAEIRAALRDRTDFEILVVDDGSAAIDLPALERLADRVIRHPRNRGYGAAIKTGIRHARGEILVILDADGTYPPEAIPRLVEIVASGGDMAVGSRQDYPASRRNLGPWHRRLAKRLLVTTANYLAETRIPDLNSGLRAFRRTDARRFLSLIPNGFSLTTTLTLAYLSEGMTIEYVPIHYRPRTGPERSKIRPFHDTLNILLTIIRTVTFFRPLKVFLPISATLIAGGLSILAYGVLTGNILDGTISVLLVSGVQMFVLGLLADVVARSRR